eukprot:c8215_g1_i2.p1 GENE.c8215_g1_i2~~c8215_g1_i2.p1  ORF type:complete len:811 (+),score=174.59 c8215_g1_i2:70-2502(+)
MKFAKELALNAVPDWQEFYVDYEKLKSFIPVIVSDTAAQRHGEALTDAESALDQFLAFVDSEIAKLDAFTKRQENHANDLFRRVETTILTTRNREGSWLPETPKPHKSPFVRRVQSAARMSNRLGSPLLKSHSDSDAFHGLVMSDLTPSRASVLPVPAPTRPNASTVHPIEVDFESNPNREFDRSSRFTTDDSDNDGTPQLMRIPTDSIAGTLVSLYTRLSDLMHFRSMNREAFRKAFKKLDKNARLSTTIDLMPKVESAYFASTVVPDQLRSQAEDLYVNMVWDGNVDLAKRFLTQNTRDLVVFRRNVIWKDIVLAEAKKSSVQRKGTSVWTFKPKQLLVSATIFAILLVSPLTFLGSGHAQRCGAMLALLICLWVTEAIPLYITSLLTPFLAVVLRVFPEHHKAEDAASYVINSMMTQVTLLILGGFSIASALSKYHLDHKLATWIISKSGTAPRRVAFAVMLVGAFLSMFLSNVASPVLCMSVMSSTIRALPRGSTFRKGLLLAIAFSCNVGGMLTPIASPQNVVALQTLNNALQSANISLQPVSFANWMLIALPIGFMLLVAIHFYLFYFWFKPDIENIPTIPFKNEPLTPPQKFTIAVTLMTIVLWCMEPMLKPFIGPEGLMAILPIVLFYGSGVLRKDDFDSLPWNVVFLVAGGSALSKAVQQSHLLDAITDGIQHITEGQSLFVVTMSFVLMIAVVTSLISHTVGAMIILPVVAQITCSGPEKCNVLHTEVLVLSCTMMCSGAMMLPVSSFPNVTAISCEDELGTPYLKSTDLLKTGGPFSVFVACFITTAGFGLSYLVFSVV